MTQLRIILSSTLGLLVCGLLAAAPLQDAGGFRPQTLKVEPYLAERAAALASVLGFANWPRPTELYAAPAVSRALFAEPARVTKEVRSCTTVPFGDAEPWEHCVWSWKALGEGQKPSATDALDLEITLAPSSRAAQEYLLTVLADNMMDTATLTKAYREARQAEGPGDVAVLVTPTNGSEARLSFTRANVVLRIRGFGALREEVLPLARRLDEQLLNQPSLTVEQLRARQN